VAWLLRAGLALVLLGALAWVAHALAMRYALQRLHDTAERRLEVEAARLEGQLARFAYLPSLLETAPEVMRLLESPGDAALRASVSRYLQTLTALAAADNLYVLDRTGLALAAADHESPGTPVGQDLSYRPYVRDALRQGRGAFYGVGITSARAGYYLAYALRARGEPRGVATVKVDLQAAEQEWRELRGDVLMLDEIGVVILSTQDAWKYRPMEPLSAAAREEATQSRRYGAALLQPLAWPVRERLGERVRRIQVDGRDYLVTEQPVNRGRWRLLLLEDEAPAHVSARWAAVSAALVGVVVLLALMVESQRRREIRQRLASREALQAAHDSLDRKVQERTAELRAAQNELVHAGKLAVLGQMSAAMVHELNQPLAALHTLSDNAVLLMERGRLDETSQNLRRIGQLVERLGRLTQELRVFAHKSGEPVRPVPVHKAVQEAASVLSHRLRERDIVLSVEVQPADLAVAAEETRLQQVLGNLIGNAIDALESVAVRRIDIQARARDGDVGEIVLRNSGPAIPPEILARLFEPFVTSKPAGKGLGLGLVISAHIVRAFGGRLQARNLEPNGVEFTIELPIATPAAQAA
jgi:two-component system C4-dicarboxylate transport sensor histidine kinase DctB